MRIKTKVAMFSVVGVLLIAVTAVIVFCARGMNLAQEQRQVIMKELSQELSETDDSTRDETETNDTSENVIDEDADEEK